MRLRRLVVAFGQVVAQIGRLRRCSAAACNAIRYGLVLILGLFANGVLRRYSSANGGCAKVRFHQHRLQRSGYAVCFEESEAFGRDCRLAPTLIAAGPAIVP
jgi:hypothetical protein